MGEEKLITDYSDLKTILSVPQRCPKATGQMVMPFIPVVQSLRILLDAPLGKLFIDPQNHHLLWSPITWCLLVPRELSSHLCLGINFSSLFISGQICPPQSWVSLNVIVPLCELGSSVRSEKTESSVWRATMLGEQMAPCKG